ncbi:MAG: GNAT family N-acetyltransferase [Mediterranea sp.]|jgi:diamine N-acetyltransferase|nr:GNAT family N-acetyltransferase [Mediterranea sp.]
MKHSYLNNDRVRLRAVEPEDLGVLYEIENDPSLWDISNFTVPYSRYVLRQYIENTQCDVFADKQLRLMIVRKEDDCVVGTIDITDYMPLHARGELGLAIRKEYQGKSYAGDALTLLCEYAFDYLSFEQLYAFIAADNVPCVKLFRSHGFLESGFLKNWIQMEGGFKDVILFQKLRG